MYDTDWSVMLLQYIMLLQQAWCVKHWEPHKSWTKGQSRLLWMQTQAQTSGGLDHLFLFLYEPCTACGWWVTDKSMLYVILSCVFVVMLRLPTMLCHDSFPPIQSHRHSLSEPVWLCLSSQQHTAPIWKMDSRVEKIFVAMGNISPTLVCIHTS